MRGMWSRIGRRSDEALRIILKEAVAANVSSIGEQNRFCSTSRLHHSTVILEAGQSIVVVSANAQFARSANAS
jgi:hypothetical protein